MENIFKQLNQEISTFLLSIEKGECENMPELSFNLFSVGAALLTRDYGNLDNYAHS